MNLFLIALLVISLFILAYRSYGRFLAAEAGLDNSRPTPATTINDGMDFVPASTPILLAQHFSSIAAAGPIVGPILAGLWFGWLPTLLWIVLGCIFIGSAHDFANIVASIRHKAMSIAEIVRENLGLRAYMLFLAFIWISLNYVIVAFTDLTVSTFLAKDIGPGVASSSILYLLLAIIVGIALYKWKIPLSLATAVALPLLVLIIWYGQKIPMTIPDWFPGGQNKGWVLIILAYCFAASILPFWLLLQPRGYLGGYFLYSSLVIGIFGIMLGGYKISYPAFVGFKNSLGAPLFPILFITVACGACSGFHGLICSGTTSKQISKEGDAHLVGYGGMLLEGLVALIALATIMILAPGSEALKLQPTEIYAHGLARFAMVLGVPVELALTFGLLAFATFVYDTLDVSTRLGRYILQELTGWQGHTGRICATFITILVPAIFLVSTKEQAYLKFWPVFGSSNQLLAALSLLGISVWLMKEGKNYLITFIPMIFVMIMTIWSLIIQAGPMIKMVLEGRIGFDINGTIAIILIVLAVLLVREACHVIYAYRAGEMMVTKREGQSG